MYAVASVRTARGPVDAALDAVGIGPAAPPARRDIQVSAVNVEANDGQLAELVTLAEHGS